MTASCPAMPAATVVMLKMTANSAGRRAAAGRHRFRPAFSRAMRKSQKIAPGRIAYQLMYGALTHGGTTIVGRTLVETWITATCTAPSRPSATARKVTAVAAAARTGEASAAGVVGAGGRGSAGGDGTA